MLFPASQEICDRSFPIDYAYLAGDVRTCGIERRNGRRAFPFQHAEHMLWQYRLMAVEHEHAFCLQRVSQEIQGMHGSFELGVEKDLSSFPTHAPHHPFYSGIYLLAFDTEEDARFVNENELKRPEQPFKGSRPIHRDQGLAA